MLGTDSVDFEKANKDLDVLAERTKKNASEENENSS